MARLPMTLSETETLLSKVKDFCRSQVVTYNGKVLISQK